MCYNKQSNFCIILLRKTRGNYYWNLNEKSVLHNKTFWKKVRFMLDEFKSEKK